LKQPPKDKTAGDVAYQVTRAGLGMVPVAGSPMQVAFENIFTEPLAKRRQEWLETLAGVVSELQEKVAGLTPEKLAENPAFVSLSLHASQMALRTHQKEKLAALRSAVFNSALPGAIDETLQMVFIRLVDEFTPVHLRMLAVLNDPVEWMKRENVRNPDWGMGGISTVIEHCLPDLRGQKELYSQIFKELYADGLLTSQSLGVTMTGSSMVRSHTTEFGKKFLGFITKPS
jgi:hypothetical protein